MTSGTPPNTSLVLTESERDFINRYYGSKSTAIHKALEILKTSKFDYTVSEDDGGSLHLFLFYPDSDIPAMAFTGFEYSPGSLNASLDSLDAGDDASTWEGQVENPQEHWDYIPSHKMGCAVICYAENGKRTLKPEKMGRAGQLEFGIETE